MLEMTRKTRIQRWTGTDPIQTKVAFHLSELAGQSGGLLTDLTGPNLTYSEKRPKYSSARACIFLQVLACSVFSGGTF